MSFRGGFLDDAERAQVADAQRKLQQPAKIVHAIAGNRPQTDYKNRSRIVSHLLAAMQEAAAGAGSVRLE
jgi:hypothetical protein